MSEFEEVPFKGEPDAMPKLERVDAGINVQLHITNRSTFLELLDAPEMSKITPRVLVDRLFVPRGGHSGGVEALQCHFEPVDDDTLSVTLYAQIADQAALRRDAMQAYVECWQDDDWTPENPSKALYELYLASNDLPSPADVGYEIGNFNYILTFWDLAALKAAEREADQPAI